MPLYIAVVVVVTDKVTFWVYSVCLSIYPFNRPSAFVSIVVGNSVDCKSKNYNKKRLTCRVIKSVRKGWERIDIGSFSFVGWEINLHQL